ncbi:MAG: glycoside hydrolase family 18 protein [Terracidiphilus sp.]
MQRGFVFLFLVWMDCCAAFGAGPAARRPVVVGYVYPHDALIQPGEMDARKLTRVNYAFASLRNGQLANGGASDDRNLATLVALKRQNPSLTVLVSVGGWFGSGGFSCAALTPESRAAFVQSAAAYIERHQLDGLDVDWEYPGQAGAGNRFRAEDRRNYTLLLTALRQSFDRLQKKLHRRLYLTIAAEASPEFLAHTEMERVEKIVDTVNLMAYDYYLPSSDPTTGHQAPLYTNPADPKKVSADKSVRDLEQAGVPADKIVLGIPFYGHAWRDVPATNDGLFQPGQPGPQSDEPVGEAAETLLKDGYVRSWDSVAQAASLYNPDKKIFVSYEDAQSIAAKCAYVRAHGLAGVMFWDAEDDPTGSLVDAIDAGLGLGPGAAK